MMKIFKVSKTDIAGKTLLQWLVEYDADVHIKILLDAGYSIFQILTKHKTIGDEGITVDFWIIKVHTSN